MHVVLNTSNVEKITDLVRRKLKQKGKVVRDFYCRSKNNL